MAAEKQKREAGNTRQGVSDELESLAMILESNPIMRERILVMLRQAKERVESRNRG